MSNRLGESERFNAPHRGSWIWRATSNELTNGEVEEYPLGLAQIEFMGEITAGRVIFGPEGTEPLLGVTALASVGITIDPANRTLKRLPAIPLK